MKSFKRIIAAVAAMTMVFGGVNITGSAAEATLKGDADINGTVDLADLTTVSKYNLSNSSYPLASEVAFANADMNDDGVVDGLDVSALIENQLGKEYITPDKTDKTVELTAGLQPLSIQSAKPSDKFEASQVDFALSLLQKTLQEKNNTLVSPYSAAQALAMTANGAKGDTLKEMMDVIGGGMGIGDFNDSMAGFKKDQPNDKGCKMLTANSIWYRNDGSFAADKNFLRTNKSYYDAEIYAAPMDDTTVNDVNSWVNEHTDKMIPKITEKFDPDIVMALVNAVTFDAKWEIPYKDSYNSNGFFKSADGKAQDAYILSETEYMPYLKDSEATGFMKKYEGGRYAFAAILPNEGTSVNDYVNSLTAEKFRKLIGSAKNEYMTTYMPKFTVDYGAMLNKPLQEMGINQAFGKDADFSRMGSSPLGNIRISSVIQKTHIDVDEEGTKAAAATIVEMVAECAMMSEMELKLDRPFVYAIVDTQTNIPIFIGTLMTL